MARWSVAVCWCPTPLEVLTRRFARPGLSGHSPIHERVSCLKENTMLRKLASALVLLSALNAPVALAASPDAEARQAQGLLAKAVAHYKDKKDLALGAFSRQGEFITGDFYVYVLDTKGTLLASGGSSALLIDRNVADMKDAVGKPFFREMLATAEAKGSGSVEYRWLNRKDRKIERKVAFFEKVGDRIVAVGYYLPHGSAAQAKSLLERAATAVKDDPKKAYAAFNDLNGSYIEDDLYVFVIGIDDGRFMAHGATPPLIGTSALSLTDINGKEFVRDMLSIVKNKDQGQIDYAWRNAVTGKVDKKHSYLRKVGNVVVGVGYYAN